MLRDLTAKLTAYKMQAYNFDEQGYLPVKNTAMKRWRIAFAVILFYFQ
jgi:hypothetical protein